MIITIFDFLNYLSIPTSQYDSQTGLVGEEDLEIYIEAANQFIADQLGYDPNLGDIDQVVTEDTDRLHLKKIPLVQNQIKINGTWTNFKYNIANEWLYFEEGKGPRQGDIVTYSAGWSYDDMPKTIKICQLRIAALLRSEADGNIGVTSKDFGESGGRSFLQFTNMRKFVLPLNNFKRFAS